MRGEGSKVSPIVISDDEGDISVAIPHTHGSSALQHNKLETVVPATGSGTATTKTVLSVGYTLGPGTGRDLRSNAVSHPFALKRKRDEDSDGPARMILEENLNNTFAKSESKKARKRRRRLERERLATGLQHLDPSFPPPHRNTGLESKPRTSHTDIVSTSQNPIPSQNTDQLPPVSDASRSTAPIHSLPDFSFSRKEPFSHNPTQGRQSEVQSSAPIPNTGLPSRPAFNLGPVESQSTLSPLASTAPMSLPVSSRQHVPPTSAQASKAKQPASAWKTTPLPSDFGGTSPPQPHSLGGHLHIYDPSRTLMLEHLPKAKRNRQFLLTWCQTTCGTAPVRMDLNTFRREVFLEFESAEVAKMAFSKLLPPDDQGRSWIKLRWYRINNEPIDGEVEEGEIEDDDNSRQRKKGSKNGSVSQKKRQKRAQPKHDRGTVQPTQSRSRKSGERHHHHHQLPPKPAPQLLLTPRPVVSPILESASAPTTSELRGLSDVQNGLPDRHRHKYDADTAAGSERAAHLANSSVNKKRNEQDLVTEDLGLKQSLKQTSTPASAAKLAICSNAGQPGPSPAMNQNGQPAMGLTQPFSRSVQSKPRPSTSKSAVVSLSSTPTVENRHSNLRVTSKPVKNVPSETQVMDTVPKGPPSLEENGERDRLANGEMNDVDHGDASCRATQVSTQARARFVGPAAVDDLRQRVRESKKYRSMGTLVNRESNVSESEPSSSMMSNSMGTTSEASLAPVRCKSPQLYSEPEKPQRAPTQDQLVLEELAVSFITETIQAIELPAKPPAASIKLELAARQQQLEKEIAESKLLMARLTSAQTKQEKDEILGAMRERTRAMKLDSAAKPAVQLPLERVEQPAQRTQPWIRWPESMQDGVLIVSDDESDEV